MSSLRERMNRLRSSAAGAASSTGGAPEGAGEQPSREPDLEASLEDSLETSIEGNKETNILANSKAHELDASHTANMDGTIMESETEAGAEQLPESWLAMGVKLQTNEVGTFLLREVKYAAAHQHGIHRLSELKEASKGLSAFHGEQIGAEHLLILDLETTGLGVGTGNVPFMVGIAYWQEQQFIVEQALIRHPAEERAMLAYLKEKLTTYAYLVTYNGRTFDWPVMLNRFILNGFGSKVWAPLHLDFLHPARSVWRNTLASCRLSHVEEERLGIERVDDVPGSLAPQLYFQYLADQNPEPLAGVFRHNEIDMLSLASLAIRFGHLLNGEAGCGPLPMPEEPEEIVRTGLWLEKMGQAEKAERLFAVAEHLPGMTLNALLLLAARDKKAGNWRRAVLLWQKAVMLPLKFGASDDSAFIELAMYYEHKLKDYESALSYADEALQMALSHPLRGRQTAKQRAELAELRKRSLRLQGKIGRKLGNHGT